MRRTMTQTIQSERKPTMDRSWNGRDKDYAKTSYSF